ncbi:MAG TPA: SPOR domain-containing protein [Allosphingosinicella sp.]|nr:SPOR domain-containing protein [Allosphingosinicella sp.]
MKAYVRSLIAAGAAASIFLCAGSALADVKKGVDAWQAGNYAAAIAEWRPLAEAGDADAQFNLGQAYKLGRGVPMNMQTAQSWYEKAARQGHGQAQALVGLILFQNGNRAGAMPWIKKGADNGDPRAQYILGTALFNGDLLGKDWPRAYALMTRAAAQGLPQATANLEQMNKFIPLDQRRQGIALAEQMRTGAPTAAPQQAAARPVRVATNAPAPIVTASRPAPARPAVAQAARPAPVQAAPGGRWRVQLGAYGDAGNAQRGWAAIRGRVGALSSLQPALVRAGAVTRLQAGPLASRAAADKVCAAAKAAGAACFPVAF